MVMLGRSWSSVNITRVHTMFAIVARSRPIKISCEVVASCHRNFLLAVLSSVIAKAVRLDSIIAVATVLASV